MDTFRNKRKKTKEIYHRINLDNFLSEYKHFQTRCASNERSSNNRADLKLNGIEILVIFAFRLIRRRFHCVASREKIPRFFPSTLRSVKHDKKEKPRFESIDEIFLSPIRKCCCIAMRSTVATWWSGTIDSNGDRRRELSRGSVSFLFPPDLNVRWNLNHETVTYFYKYYINY